MKLVFHIDYRTNWGENVYITGNVDALGGGDEAKAPMMKLSGESSWTITAEVPDGTEPFDYRFLVRNDDGAVKREWPRPHRCIPAKGVSLYQIYDRWQDQPLDKPFYASAFYDCVFRRRTKALPQAAATGELTVSVDAPAIRPDQVLAISGASESLGAWDPKKARRMDDSSFPTWRVNIPVDDLTPETEYKFVVLESSTGEVVSWEGGANRRIGVATSSDAATVTAGMRFINHMPLWRGAGTAIPVFSIRTDDDFGVGDFADIARMVDWCVATGQTFLQLLPVNDTTMTHTWTDSYPYNANSTFALHPMYLRLEDVGTLKDKKRMEYYEALRKELNELPEIDYERVNNAKTEYLRELFAQDKAKIRASKAFKAFVAANASWLMSYAAFCTLRDIYKTPDFSKWGDYAVYSKDKLDIIYKEHRDELDFNCFLQYHLDLQMRAAHEYANVHGVALKGDIPIGISRTSADAWVNPKLFYMDCQAGAPPDDFSVLGQNWGFPTYNWEEMNKDGFAWWKARFRKMSEYFDSYRIDHVLGFFRIWQIPMDALHGLLGVFNPALPYSVDEMRYNYDFWINTDWQTRPFIMDYFLADFFGPYTSEVKKLYLNEIGGGRRELKPEFDTQRKIADYFATQPKDEKNRRICDGLIGLVDQVLFIEDPEQKGKYHPRISAQFTYAYRALNDYERWCFDRLYNDFYYRRHNDFWYGKAMWKLPPLIDSTDMLVCAEDLGMIPACVPAVMQQLEILALEIQRMPKNPSHAFGVTSEYPYFSVCTTSTHDMSGIRGWWEEDREKTQRFFNTVLHESGPAPYYAEPWICSRIIDQHLASPSMLCILPLQDWLSMDGHLRRHNPADERINVPANSRHYWRYRMHLTVEELSHQKEFNDMVLAKVRDNGR